MHGSSTLSLGDSSSGQVFFQSSPTPAETGDSLGVRNSPDVYEGVPRLKGVCWPGMNLFDAANDEMKRMRNQRKDQSVIDQMEAFSAKITRDELVYNLDFELERIRDVYASPSVPSSPVSTLVLRRLAMIP